MIVEIIFCVIVCCAEYSKGLLEQLDTLILACQLIFIGPLKDDKEQEHKNDCGTLTVSQPAIDGKYVLLTFIPNGLVDDQTEVAWKYQSTFLPALGETDISNSTKYILSSRNTTYTMDLYCDKYEVSERQFSATLITSTEECISAWIEIYVRDAPELCGILYSEAKQIKPNDEVVLKYYAPLVVLSEKQYIRQVRRRTDDCWGQFGCPVNQTWYEEEYKERNSVYLYTFRDFTPDMGGHYLIQCTNRPKNGATNAVRLIIPVPPSTPTFLNTMDIDDCESCIPVENNTYVDIKCQVLGGGTLPVTVKIVIAEEEERKCNFGNPSYTRCRMPKYITSSLHLKEIRCEAVNEAIRDPLSTSTKLYVVEKTWGPTLISRQQSKGKVNIYCYNRRGRTAPELTMLIDGNLINTTNVANEDTGRKHIKLTYLKRDWNGAKIECCMHHLYFTEPKCSEGKIDYLFSPASIKLTASEPEPSGTGTFLQTLRCTITNANPACKVKWSHPDGADVTIGTEEITRPAGQGGCTTVSELLLNGSVEVDGSAIDCKPICDKFETRDIAIYTIRIPSKDEQNSASRENTLPWKYIGIGTAAGVVVLVLVAILVIRRRRKTDSHKTAHENVHMNASSDQAMVNEPRDKQNGSDAYETIFAHENIPTNASSGQALIKEQTDEQNGSNAYEIFIEPCPSDSVYTDLILPTEGATSGDPERAYAETQTEHVSTKFNKVGEQLPELSDIELENIYVNQ